MHYIEDTKNDNTIRILVIPGHALILKGDSVFDTKQILNCIFVCLHMIIYK
jgi:hypothetical protein